MRIYDNCYELMSEMGRNLWEMGGVVCPKHYQNKEAQEGQAFTTKELICEQYCLVSMEDPEWLMIFLDEKSKNWAREELRERLSGKTLNPGTAWVERADLWKPFMNRVGKLDYSYPERMNENVSYQGDYMTKLEAIISLLKDDPETRKAILNIYGGYQDKFGWTKDEDYLDGSHRIPCSMYYNFLIRKDAKGNPRLHICYHQRSSDFVTFFGTDVWFAWNLMLHVAKEVGVTPGYMYHTIDSIHAYEPDWIKLKNSLSDMRK